MTFQSWLWCICPQSDPGWRVPCRPEVGGIHHQRHRQPGLQTPWTGKMEKKKNLGTHLFNYTRVISPIFHSSGIAPRSSTIVIINNCYCKLFKIEVLSAIFTICYIPNTFTPCQWKTHQEIVDTCKTLSQLPPSHQLPYTLTISSQNLVRFQSFITVFAQVHMANGS